MLVSAFLLGVALADAGDPPPPPIVGGLATADFPQVGVLLAYDEARGGFAFCSGTLIHKRWVLTAGHCLDNVGEYTNEGLGIYFLVGTNLYTDGGVASFEQVTGWVRHPDYDPETLIGDLALMELGAEMALTPLPLNAEPVGEGWDGELLSYVGWGITADDGEDSGIKRYAEIPFYDADGQFIYAYDDAGQNLCNGDSGGAGMRQLPSGAFVLAGVNSFVYEVENADTACLGGGSGATRVDKHLAWIASHVPLEENVGAAQTPALEEALAAAAHGGQAIAAERQRAMGCSALGAPGAGMLLASLLSLGGAIRRRR